MSLLWALHEFATHPMSLLWVIHEINWWAHCDLTVNLTVRYSGESTGSTALAQIFTGASDVPLPLGVLIMFWKVCELERLKTLHQARVLLWCKSWTMPVPSNLTWSSSTPSRSSKPLLSETSMTHVVNGVILWISSGKLAWMEIWPGY